MAKNRHLANRDPNRSPAPSNVPAVKREPLRLAQSVTKKAAMPLLQKLAHLEDGRIHTLLQNSKAVEDFPFLRDLQASGATCGGCAQTRKELDVMSRVKQAFAGLDDMQKAKLKKHLGAEQVRITMKRADGSVHNVQF